MADDIKRIDIAEFRDKGYLQELNRRFLHPLGMALEVRINEEGTQELGGVWDYRDDPKGMFYDGIDLEEKALSVEAEWKAKRATREAALGYMVQPAL